MAYDECLPNPTPSTLLLVGAGASFGAGGINRRPPLGTQLYEHLAGIFPSWKHLSEPWATNFNSIGFEQALFLVPLSTRCRLVNDMALYFDSFRIDDASSCAYSRLARELKDSGALARVVFTSLNYETLLEQAFERIGVEIRHRGPCSQPCAWFIKPHGSSNYVFVPDANIDPLEAQALGMSLRGECVVLRPGELTTDPPVVIPFGHSSRYPVMAHYDPVKLAPVGTDLIMGLRREWKQLAESVRKVVVVGVRPTNTDTTIWAPLTRTQAEVVFVNPSETDHLEATKLRPQIRPITSGIADAVTQIIRECTGT